MKIVPERMTSPPLSILIRETIDEEIEDIPSLLLPAPRTDGPEKLENIFAAKIAATRWKRQMIVKKTLRDANAPRARENNILLGQKSNLRTDAMKKLEKRLEERTHANLNKTTASIFSRSRTNYKSKQDLEELQDLVDDLPKSHYIFQVVRDTLYVLLIEVISAENNLMYYWDWLIVLLTLYTVLWVSFQIAFPIATSSFSLLDRAIELTFIGDIILNFRRAYFDEDRYQISSIEEIRRRYLSKGFWVDALSTFPLEALLTLIFTNLQEQDISCWLKMNHLIRITKLHTRVDALIDSQYGRILNLLASFCLAGHLIGCTFMIIGRLQSEDVVGGRWIDVYDITSYNLRYQYTTCLYWAFATLGTVGYGDITATSWIERLFASFTMLFGAGLYASIFGSFTNLIERLEKKKNMYNERQMEIKEYCRSNNLPAFLQKRLIKYHDAAWQLERFSNDNVFLNLPLCVKTDVMMVLYAGLLQEVPLFEKLPKRTIEKIVMCFKQSIYFSGDWLVRQGDEGQELFFLVEGVVDIWVCKKPKIDILSIDFEELYTNSTFVTQRESGSFFGESCLTAKERRNASIIAFSDMIQVLSISKKDFEASIAGNMKTLEILGKETEQRDLTVNLKPDLPRGRISKQTRSSGSIHITNANAKDKNPISESFCRQLPSIIRGAKPKEDK